MNRELGCQIDTHFIEHIAFFNEENSQIEIYAEFLKNQEILLKKGTSKERYHLQKGERIPIEISRKYKIQDVTERLNGYGLEALATYSNAANWFGLLLLEKIR